MNFNEKVIWITGASSGIGEYTAYEFAKTGATLILSARREDELKRVQQNCLNIGGKCSIYLLDLTNTQQTEETCNNVIHEFNKVDILFNNGGMSQRSYTLETPVEVDRKIMELNFFGQVALTKQVLPHMIKNGGGHIAVTSSITGKFGFPLRSAYAASKHALHGFFESVYLELAKQNINVTIICPGRVKTNISYNALTKDGTPHGVMDEGQEEGISPEKCAKQIVKAIKQNKREALIGGKELLMVHFKRYIPSLFYRIAKNIKPT